jgi:predicted HTH transcriptional regulator
MSKKRIFISSVQKEFEEERKNLYHFLLGDPLLGVFFEPFLFENLPAFDQKADDSYIKEVSKCDIYIGLLGAEYGYQDGKGISPTEKEYNEATKHFKTRLIYVKGDGKMKRHPKVAKFIKNIGIELIRKRFNSSSELNAGVYASLVIYLMEQELIRTSPFDATYSKTATLADLDGNKISAFLELAKAKRGFPLPANSSASVILTHLNLISEKRINHAAILLFGKKPQQFFITSEIKCAHFHGTDIRKPIPSYQVYKGDVFQLVDQAVDFVLSKISVEVGTRDLSNQVPIDYEIPRGAVSEAIVNAVAHRDYTSNGSVQVMLFKDRLEIWNPGHLPFGLSTAKLRQPHNSIPANPLLAEPMYLAGYIERMGTGTGDIIRLCKEKGLKAPEFIQEEDFRTIIWRTPNKAEKELNTPQATGEVSGEATGEVSGEVAEEIKRVVLVLNEELKRLEIQNKLGLKSDDYFRVNYILPALESGYIELTFPESPKHPNQRYRLTQTGIALKKQLQKNKKKK